MKYVLTYGIACIENQNGVVELIKSIPDITTDREAAEHLLCLINECDLSPDHLGDVIEDMLSKA